MKKLLFIAVGLIATTSYAASTGTLLLQGVVAPVNTITVVQTALQLSNATSLNITGGEVAKDVASVDESSNNLNGYKIFMRSGNGLSKLVHGSDASKSTAYTISYDGGPYKTLTAVNQEVKDSGLLSGLTPDTSAVAVNVTAYPSAPAGTYSDTVTISIIAN